MRRCPFSTECQLHKSDFGTEMLKCSSKLFPKMQPVQFVQITCKICRVIFSTSELQHNSLNAMLSNKWEKKSTTTKLTSLKHDDHNSSQYNALVPVMESKFYHGNVVVVSATGTGSFIAISAH